MSDLYKRKDWIDALRALALLFVMIGHLIPTVDSFFIFTSPIKIPLFFAISGYLFNTKNLNQQLFLKNLFFKIVIPWLILSGSIYLLVSFIKGYHYFLRSMYEILTGDILWFMPCFVVGKIIFFYSHKFTKNYWSYIISISFCILGFILAQKDALNIFMINRALIAQIFLLIGVLIRKYENLLLNRVYVIISLLVYLSLCAFCYLLFPNIRMDIHLNHYYNEMYTIIMIFVGCFFAFGIIRIVNRFPRYLLEVGKNTLLIYILHSYIYSFFNYIQKTLFGTLYKNTIMVVAYVVITCAICLVISAFLNRFAPFVLGHSKRTTNKLIQ